MMDPISESVEALVPDIEVGAPSITLVSSMTGRVLESDQVMDGEYWGRQIRQPVEYRRSVEALADLGVDAVVEVGPGAVLGPMTILCWPEQADSAEPIAVSSMKRPSDRTPAPEDGCGFLDAVVGAYGAGVDICFEGLYGGETRRRISIPGYPFQRQRHWVEAPKRRRSSAGHPLLGVCHESPRGELQYETEMDASDPAWLNDHRVYGQVITPGALYGSMATAALAANGSGRSSTSMGRNSGTLMVEELQLHSPMVFGQPDSDDGEESDGRQVQFVIDEADPNAPARFEIYSRGSGEDGWTLHAEGLAHTEAGRPEGPDRVDLGGLKAGLESKDVSEFYRSRTSTGVELGAPFRTLRSLWAADGEAVGELSLPEGVDGGGVEIHPLLLDGCFQVMAEARSMASTEDGVAYLPFGWERLVACRSIARPGGLPCPPAGGGGGSGRDP